MKAFLRDLRILWRGDASGDRVVPPSGYTVRLTIFSAAAMGFLAVMALALALSAGRLADDWGGALARSATLRIDGPLDTMQERTEAALRVLEQTPGVASAQALTEEEQRALLEPWFGPDLQLESLPIPQLIEIEKTPEGFDAEGLRLRLEGEVPGAMLDDHESWRKPFLAAARALRWLGWGAMVLIGATMAAIVTLAASVSLAANAQVISVLRLIGARDDYIARAFIRRFTFRTLTGAAVGTGLGLIASALLPDAPMSFLTGIGFANLDWLVPFAIPPLAALVAFAATRRAAFRTLRGLS
ncbi:cell division transport system permease protein [Poseidonocella pacifica]|uniref:Cell division transport system permease protein n=1 Tax=Poseidonocella pacifica TaxID=871651 RepID=A0A1I0WNP3_9RHOB|nr:FtsX-like permease family protein [Poseidonocella pacifica]SFA90369.1 cell division transport system permease protein [Poseidonocella pacifica]